MLIKAYKYQKCFLKAIVQDYTSDILFLDSIPEGSSLPSFHQILLSIKLTKLPHLSLFHLIDHTWNRMQYQGDFMVLYMLYLAKEVEIILNNCILYFVHNFGEDALLYFTKLAKKKAKDDK